MFETVNVAVYKYRFQDIVNNCQVIWSLEIEDLQVQFYSSLMMMMMMMMMMNCFCGMVDRRKAISFISSQDYY